MKWVVMGFEGTGTQVGSGRCDLRYGDSHEKQRGVITGSFVAKFIKQCSAASKEYFPGPNAQGSDCDDIFRDAQTWFEDYKLLGKIKICLTGYSRGAYIAMCFAKYLQSIDFQVEYMGLFDPVSRDSSIQNPAMRAITVPDNVKNVRVTYRSDRIGSRRTSMNNVGLKYKSGKKIDRLECPGSHGSLGGFPNGAGIFDKPKLGQGHPKSEWRFHPDKEFTAWWMSGNHISEGAESCSVPVKRLVPADKARFCIPERDWYKKVEYKKIPMQYPHVIPKK